MIGIYLALKMWGTMILALPGDMMGTQQSGILELKIANIVKDKDILSLARHWAKKVLVADPKLSDPKHQPITQTYIKMGKYKNIWNYIS